MSHGRREGRAAHAVSIAIGTGEAAPNPRPYKRCLAPPALLEGYGAQSHTGSREGSYLGLSISILGLGIRGRLWEKHHFWHELCQCSAGRLVVPGVGSERAPMARTSGRGEQRNRGVRLIFLLLSLFSGCFIPLGGSGGDGWEGSWVLRPGPWDAMGCNAESPRVSYM